jgi:hypothetical protein
MSTNIVLQICNSQDINTRNTVHACWNGTVLLQRLQLAGSPSRAHLEGYLLVVSVHRLLLIHDKRALRGTFRALLGLDLSGGVSRLREGADLSAAQAAGIEEDGQLRVHARAARNNAVDLNEGVKVSMPVCHNRLVELPVYFPIDYSKRIVSLACQAKRKIEALELDTRVE